MPVERSALSANQITSILAERLMGWRSSPERFLIGNRRSFPRWRFQPFGRLQDARKILEMAATSFVLTMTADRTFSMQVRIGKAKGIATGKSEPAVITTAIARAIGLQVADQALEQLEVR
jgi:hypothetical protein